jgi:hypothetical protein
LNDCRKWPVGIFPSSIVVSTVYPSIIYVLNIPFTWFHIPMTISVIDGSIDKVTAGITFNVHPANSGGIICNNREYPTNTYLYVANGTECIASPAKGFEFSSWVENLPKNSNISLPSSGNLTDNRYGTFIVNFKPLPPPIQLTNETKRPTERPAYERNETNGIIVPPIP